MNFMKCLVLEEVLGFVTGNRRRLGNHIANVMLITSLQQSCNMLTIECKTSSVIQNTGYFIPGLGEQGLTQMSG